MKSPDDLQKEIETLRDRLSRFREASLQINQSLDFDTVLQDVLDSARSLTGGRYGVITLLDDAGQLQNFLSSGLSPEQASLMWNLPGGMALFDYLNQLSEPLRLADMFGHMKKMGIPWIDFPVELSPAIPLLAAPIFDQGKRVGGLYVSEKVEGAEFTEDDHETLAIFASQAAMVIANARRYRDEQKARMDLETLMNTSPVGVVVFDARTGQVESINREARRLSGELGGRDQSAEEMVKFLTIRRADGREVSLAEFPLQQMLAASDTLIAEEIVVKLPDGRSITALVNVTPIRTEDGEVGSVLVTIQDMTPLEELERMRTEFLAMISHELRTPLSSIRGSATALLDDGPAMDPAEVSQFHRIILDQTDRMRSMITDLLDVARIETGTLAVKPEPTEVLNLIDEAKHSYLRAGGRDNVQVEVLHDLPLAMADRRRIVQVLENLLVNAARNSPEPSPIKIGCRS